ncbi:acyl carrier protein, mitochondrial-like [Brevipalpus obovatus]|uniref:acyl carrier protein, mitochondrial-like n=1 Tax=Brevipalpus obovatus TaxID=246614 RepID=UPI003D9F9C3A
MSISLISSSMRTQSLMLHLSRLVGGKTSARCLSNCVHKELKSSVVVVKASVGNKLPGLLGHERIYHPSLGYVQKRYSHRPALTYDFARDRIMFVLRLYDKIDPEKLTLDSHFSKDLGLDSLDQCDIIYMFEAEFEMEIPNREAEKLWTPRDILTYITDSYEAYEGLQEHH